MHAFGDVFFEARCVRHSSLCGRVHLRSPCGQLREPLRAVCALACPLPEILALKTYGHAIMRSRTRRSGRVRPAGLTLQCHSWKVLVAFTARYPARCWACVLAGGCMVATVRCLATHAREAAVLAMSSKVACAARAVKCGHACQTFAAVVVGPGSGSENILLHNFIELGPL